VNSLAARDSLTKRLLIVESIILVRTLEKIREDAAITATFRAESIAKGQIEDQVPAIPAELPPECGCFKVAH
jgi:hypothetical protein